MNENPPKALYLPRNYIIAAPRFSSSSPNDRAAQVAAYARGWYEANRESWWTRTRDVPKLDAFMRDLVEAVLLIQARCDAVPLVFPGYPPQARRPASASDALPDDFVAQLRTIAATLDDEWGIAALKVRAAAVEIERLRAIVDDQSEVVDDHAAERLDRAAAMAREPFVPEHPHRTDASIADALRLLARALDADEAWTPDCDAARAEAQAASGRWQERRRAEINPSLHPEVAGLDHTGFALRAEDLGITAGQTGPAGAKSESFT